jgi:lysophospholipid acyltransferase (LPLAT)-like uncharacterized protein
VALTRTQRAQAAAIGGVGYPAVALLGRTWRWRVEGGEIYDGLVRAGRTPILALWHGRILPATLYWRDRGIVAMTSHNFDGEWIGRLMSRFGYRAARGSTSRGGSRALVQLRRELAAGHAAAFTVDGPRGPAEVAQPGALWLAGATGHPVLPFHIEASRSWTVPSWDRTIVPSPFSLVAVAIGDPLEVPGTADDLVEDARQELERRLGRLRAQCAAMLYQPAGAGHVH